MLETTLDDLSPQLAGFVCERALAEGALDAWLTPVVMKKQRPGFVLTVLAPLARQARLAGLLLRETTTLGVRVTRTRRLTLPRRQRWVATPWGRVRVKIAPLGPAEPAKITPEYEDCRALALAAGVPLRRVQEAARRAADPAPAPPRQKPRERC